MSRCLFCKWIRTQPDAGFDPAGRHVVNKASEDWEWLHSNEAALEKLEPVSAQFGQAAEIWASDQAAAIPAYLELAEQGSIHAMLKVAWYYGWASSSSVAPRFDLAQRWYIRAINAGSWMATRYYAQLLFRLGRFDACERLLEDGVRKNWPPAYYWLAWFRYNHPIGAKDYTEIRRLLEYAAGQGHPMAQLQLARWMAVGKFGLRLIPKGVKLLRRQMQMYAEG